MTTPTLTRKTLEELERLGLCVAAVPLICIAGQIVRWAWR